MAYLEHWADLTAKRVLERFPGREEYICASGITPSGTVHIGNFRDVITSDLVVRSLRDHGASAHHILVWDNYDRFRNVPANIPQNHSQYLGRAISNIPDPFGGDGVYADHFIEEFEELLPMVGVRTESLMQSERYEQGFYVDGIKIAMQKRRKIAEILASFKTQDTTSDEVDGYFPYRPYCNECGRDTTSIDYYDEDETIDYSCKCGNSETINFAERNVGKLSWKVDWAMRWGVLNVAFEPGGRDHFSDMGSFRVSSRIAKEIFGIDLPVSLVYEFIGIEGMSKMSSSSGKSASLGDILGIYEPEMVRFFFSKIDPQKPLTFYFGSEVIREYDGFDRVVNRSSRGKSSLLELRSLELARIHPERAITGKRVPFRKVASLGQVVQGEIKSLEGVLDREGESYDPDLLNQRMNCALYWVNAHRPDMRISLREDPNKEYFDSLGRDEQDQIRTLAASLSENFSHGDLTTLVYAIPKKDGMLDQEKKDAQRRFFRNCYHLLIDEDTGPRLPTFLIAIGKERLEALFNL